MDYTELSDDFLKKLQSLHKIGAQKCINEVLRGEIFILGYIAKHNQSVLPGEIGSEMGVTSARIASALNALENKGLITRQIYINDRRKILVGITEEGKLLSEKHKQGVKNAVVRMFERLGEKDAKEYVRILGKLVEILPEFDEFL